jgi:hypothetical protein
VYNQNPCPVANCAQCNSNRACVTCASGYTLYAGACYYCNVPNCAVCSGYNYCSTCNPTFQTWYGQCKCPFGYSNVNGLCTLNSPIVCSKTNCAQYDASCNCVACSSPQYAVYNGNCVLCNIANCGLCKQSNVCYQCNNGFQLTNSNECQCTKPNCAYCDALGRCQQCLNNYDLIGYDCYLHQPSNCGANCQDCGPNNYCITCNSNFYNIAGVCYGCLVNYCATCYTTPFVCKTCINNYFLVAGNC